ncbi:GMP/IMP nucleotidase [Hahella sp. NBU794]|uniref:GMP/IMP nucleotidase n=1 Tax=Hahella sp. NBU794 TaxID=3422590 RepID=UPI003D6F6A17
MLDWSAIDTILLDMDGTLLDLHFDNFFWMEHLPKRLAELKDIHPEVVSKDLLDKVRQLQGQLNWYCLDYWSRELDVDIPTLKEEVRHLIGYRPFVEEFLKTMRDSHHRVVMVTNAHRKSLDLKLRQVDLTPYFDNIVSSHDFGVPKEDNAFWSRLQEVEPFQPDRALLIDDSLPVLRSAKEYGVAHLLAVLHPDSKRPANEETEFKGILHFDQILPANVFVNSKV